LIELRDVCRHYGTGRARIEAVKDVRMKMKQGDLISIVGPSGCGKTTLLYLMGLLERPSSGAVLVEDKDMSRSGDRALSKVRLRRIGFVFQQFYLLPSLTAIENVMVPMREAGLGRSRSRERAETLLKDVGMSDRTGHLPGRMSGGEQQRVAIARALANDPEMILADEPTGELDSENTSVIMDMLTELNRSNGKSLVIVTHDPDVARRGKRVLKMKDGRLTGR